MRKERRVRRWLEGYGVTTESHELRNNIHVLEYLVVGLAVFTFGASQNWRITTCTLLRGGIALLDENIKVLLPTREFDLLDLTKDCIGVAVSTGMIVLIRRVKADK